MDMEALRQKILREATASGGNVNVDSFLNHQVDTDLLGQMAEELTHRIDLTGVTKVLTAETSGIAMAAICAYRFGLPLVYAKRVRSEPSEVPVYKSTVFSFTAQYPTTFVVNKEFLSAGDTVLIVDDFLAGGQSMRGLVDIVRQSGAKLRGVAVAIEKQYEGGGDRLRGEGIPVESLAIIKKADKDGFEFA